MISQIVITFLGWLALMFISTNLIGMLVRGLVLISEVKKLIAEGNDAFKKVVAEFYKQNEERRVNVIASVLIVIYLIAVFYFWNIGVVIAAVMIMIARIPDLLWEMKYGGVSECELLKRADLADAVIAVAEKHGIDTKNETEASMLGEFVVTMTMEGKVSRKSFKNMPARYMLTLLIMFAALPVLWYALYRL